MKIRMLALAGVAAVALSAPAHAGDGWYLGLGAGYDSMSSIHTSSVTIPTQTFSTKTQAGAIIAGSFGYGWTSGLRIEDEIAYNSHSVNASSGFGGSASVSSDMVNLVYDIPIGDAWKISLGGGLGGGDARVHLTVPGTAYDWVKESHLSFEYQGIAGLAYSLSPDVDLFFDYRYRSNQNSSGSVATSYTALAPVKVGDLTENVFMVGFRWFMTPPPPRRRPRRRPLLRRRLPRLRLRRRLRRRRRPTSSSSTSISRT